MTSSSILPLFPRITKGGTSKLRDDRANIHNACRRSQSKVGCSLQRGQVHASPAQKIRRVPRIRGEILITQRTGYSNQCYRGEGRGDASTAPHRASPPQLTLSRGKALSATRFINPPFLDNDRITKRRKEISKFRNRNASFFFNFFQKFWIPLDS